MKIKFFLPILFIILLGSGCANNKIETIPKEPMYSQEEKQLSPPTSSAGKQGAEGVKVVGAYYYFITEAPAAFSKTAIGKVCLEPAQNELANGGNIFCFQNTTEALNLLKIDTTLMDKKCKEYWGLAQVLVRDLSSNKAEIFKSSPCVSSGTCPFNEAVLVQVEEVGYTEPKCNK